MQTLLFLTCTDGYNQTGGPILELFQRNLDIVKRVRHISKPDRISNSTTGKWATYMWQSFKQQGTKLFLFFKHTMICETHKFFKQGEHASKMSVNQKVESIWSEKVEVFFHSNSVKRFFFRRGAEVPLLSGRLEKRYEK